MKYPFPLIEGEVFHCWSGAMKEGTCISNYYASTALNLDMCPDFMGGEVRQAWFLFNTSQEFLPLLEQWNTPSLFRGHNDKFWSTQNWTLGRVYSTFKNRWEMWNGCNFRVISMRGRGISISWPCKLRLGRGTHIFSQSCAGLLLLGISLDWVMTEPYLFIICGSWSWVSE